MTSKLFRVAGHIFRLSLPDSPDLWKKLANYRPFLIKDGKELFSLELTEERDWPVNGFEVYYKGPEEGNEPKMDLFRSGNAWLAIMAPICTMQPVAGLIMEEDFKRGKLYVKDVERYGRFAIDNALMLMFAFSTSTLGTLEMHASVVTNEGKAYLFTAPSGTGKSTHSRMWLENIPGTELLNDDNPVLRIMEDGSARVFGTPWSGKTPCYKAKDVPAGGIVRIKRAPYNRITRLQALPAYASLASSCSGLKAIESMADGLHESLSATVTTVPCYELECLPDAEAAFLCHDTMCGSRTIPNELLIAEVGQMLSEGKDVIIKTKGNSMMPFIIGDRDSVKLRKMPSVSKGDMVLAEVAPKRYVLHRVIREDGEHLTLMGDGNLKGTENCTRDRVLGTVLEIIHPDEKTSKPSKGRIWALLKPFRRYILWTYRKMI